jgi:type IV fimbrial biogenesis protein FimT
MENRTTRGSECSRAVTKGYPERHDKCPANAARGFTLIELLVAISIAAIMMTIAIPSFRDFLLNSRMTSQTNDFVLALASARSEAVKRGVLVSVCSRATNATCAANTTWDNGWLVFVDNNGDGTVNGADAVLQVRALLEGDNTLRAGALNNVTFRNTGNQDITGALDTFRLCDTRGTANGRSITITMQGQVTSATGTATCP